MIPDTLQWSFIRRRHFCKTLKGFQAHVLSYATSDCEFAEFVSLHKNTKLFSSRLGRATYIAGANLSNVTTGKFCSIGQGARLGLGRHPTNFLSTHPAFYSIGPQTQLRISQFPTFVEEKPIVLGNDIWIGADSLIMGGITIGDGAIVGAGSIVTKDIPAYAIAVGSPAKIARYRFDEKTIALLLRMQWWNQSDHEIERLARVVSRDGPIDLIELERWAEAHPLK